MNKFELKEKLDLLGVDPNLYSLNEGLKPDCIILNQNYAEWEVFYLDERGGRNEQKEFTSESEACQYVFQLFESAKKLRTGLA